MKRTVRKLALRRETVRALRRAELTRANGGMQCGYTISQLVCPNTWCASCVSCDCEGTD